MSPDEAPPPPGPPEGPGLWVLLSAARAPAATLDALLGAHRAWLTDLERADLLFASGPLDGGGGPLSHGLTIVRAPSRGEAERLAATDPFVTAGAHTVQVFGWEARRGRPHLHARLGPGDTTLS